MPLFDRFRRPQPPTELDMADVRRRVHGIRRAGEAAPTLTDLFSLVGERDVIPPRQEQAPPPESDARRIMPDQIPTTLPLPWQ